MRFLVVAALGELIVCGIVAACLLAYDRVKGER